MREDHKNNNLRYQLFLNSWLAQPFLKILARHSMCKSKDLSLLPGIVDKAKCHSGITVLVPWFPIILGSKTSIKAYISSVSRKVHLCTFKHTYAHHKFWNIKYWAESWRSPVTCWLSTCWVAGISGGLLEGGQNTCDCGSVGGFGTSMEVFGCFNTQYRYIGKLLSSRLADTHNILHTNSRDSGTF